MLIVIALGGNALLQRGEPLEADLQKANVKSTAKAIAELAKNHQVVICHGNGPQVGLLALQNEAYTDVKNYPLDVLDAQTQGMIGYLIQHEIGNELGGKSVVTVLTQVVVTKNDPAFKNPSKPIGPIYNKEQADSIAVERGWKMAPDGQHFRRVVPSPQPKGIVELSIIRKLLDENVTVICGGGGGIPVLRNGDAKLEGVEAVIDKDSTASFMAERLGADKLVILTDVSAACIDFGTPREKKIRFTSPDSLRSMNFARGSMGPKISASCRFVENTNRTAAIGKLSELLDIINGKAGTQIQATVDKMTYYE
jgi:carbamate kinase